MNVRSWIKRFVAKQTRNSPAVFGRFPLHGNIIMVFISFAINMRKKVFY